MDINQFQLSLLHSLSSLDFVKTVDFHTEVFILKGRIVTQTVLSLCLFMAILAMKISNM